MMRALALAAALLPAACAPAAPAHDDVPQRIVSLIPSLTEDLFAIGAGPEVVGVSTFTDYPPQARRLPVVGTATSVDAERIVRLHADLAVGITAQTPAAAELRGAGVRTLLLHNDGFEDIFRCLDALGVVTGRVDDARTLADRLRARTAALLHAVHKGARLPSVFVVLGVGPIYTVGSAS